MSTEIVVNPSEKHGKRSRMLDKKLSEYRLGQLNLFEKNQTKSTIDPAIKKYGSGILKKHRGTRAIHFYSSQQKQVRLIT
jgi:hypothetical protein